MSNLAMCVCPKSGAFNSMMLVVFCLLYLFFFCSLFCHNQAVVLGFFKIISELIMSCPFIAHCEVYSLLNTVRSPIFVQVRIAWALVDS